MKQIKLITAALLLHAVAFAQSLKVEICNNPVSFKSEDVYIKALSCDSFLFFDRTNLSEVIRNAGKDEKISLSAIKGRTVLFDTKKCAVLYDQETGYYEVDSLFHPPTNNPGKNDITAWEGKFNGEFIKLIYNDNDNKRTFSIIKKQNEEWFRKELFDILKEKNGVLTPTFVAISPNAKNMVILSSQGIKAKGKAYLVNGKLEVVSVVDEITMPQMSLSIYETQDFPLMPRVSINNDAVVFYRLGSSIVNAKYIQQIVAVNMLTGSKKEFPVNSAFGDLQWASFVNIGDNELYAFAAVCSKKQNTQIVGFVFWTLHTYKDELFLKEEYKEIPYGVLYYWQSKGRYKSIPWGQRTCLIPTNDGGFMLINKIVDRFNLGYNEPINKDIIVLHFTRDRNCDWGKIIFRDIRSLMVNKQLSNENPEYLQVFQLDSSVLFVYHSESSPRIPGPRDKRKLKPGVPYTWITQITHDGKVKHYEVLNQSGNQIKIKTSSQPQKKGESVHTLRVVVDKQGNYDLGVVEIITRE